VTVNSMTEPVLPMETGKWYRLRMLMASTMYMINGNGVGESVGSCTFLLMAKDSIYLFDSLRPISKLFLYPGSRADIMAKCDMPGDVMFESAYFAGQEALTHHVPNYVGPIFNLSVVESAHHEPMLPQFEVQRPCYVADTQSILGDEAYVTKKPIIYDVCEAYPGGGAPPVEHRKLAGEFNEDGTHYWTYSDMPGTSGYAQAFGMTCNQLADNIFQARTGLYCVNGCALELGTRHGVGNYTGTQTTTLMSQDNEAAVAAAHEVNEYYGTPCLLVNEDQHLTVGTIVEWDVWGIDYHPVHFHVNPYQLVDIDYELGNQQGVTFDAAQFELLTGNFYHLGDYGDVMMIPAKHVTLHQQLNNFASAMVNHCHILFHEDVGMMNVYAINGEDGTFARSQEVDPMCYWTSAQKTGYSVTAVCHSDLDCPTGWACHMSSDEDEDRRRALKFGHMTGGVCTEMEM
jgi:FtsP/CotA-like multicopper oxidase with cupredoxin domain